MNGPYRVTGEDAAALRDTPDVAPEGVQGSTSSNTWGGLPDDEHNRKLQANADVKLYRQMERSPSVVPFERSLMSHLLSGSVALEESENTDEAAAEYVETILGIGRPRPAGMRPFETDLAELWRSLTYGRTTHRIQTWAEDGLTKFKLHYTEPDSVCAYVLDEYDNLVAVDQHPSWDAYSRRETNKSGGYGVRLDANRVVHLAFNQVGRNFNGVGIYRAVYPLWREAEKLYNVDVVGNTRFASPSPLVQIDYKAAQEAGFQGEKLTKEVEKATAQLKKFTSHEQSWLALPTWMNLSVFPEGLAYDSEPVLKAIAHREHRIALQFSAGLTLLGDQHSGGNRALGNTNERQLERWAENLGQWLAGELNTQLLARLQRYHFGESVAPEAYARIRFTGLRLPAWLYHPELVNGFIDRNVVKPGSEAAHEVRAVIEWPKAEHEDDYGPDQRGPGAQQPQRPSLTPPSSRRNRPAPNSLPSQDPPAPENPEPETPEVE